MSTPYRTSYTPLRPRRSVQILTPYVLHSNDPVVDLRLDNNEAPASIAADVSGYFRTVHPDTMRRYPDPVPLEGMIAESWGIGASQVVVTAGADDALERALLVTLDTDRGLVSVVPTFEMIPRYATIAGGTIREIAWDLEEFPVDSLLEAIGPETGSITIVTPNNPTGSVAPPADLIRIARAARDVGAVVIVDLAYVEFSDNDPTRMLLAFDNVVVIRTFSKAWGLAGLRVGYAIAKEPLATWIRIAGSPYPVSGPSLHVARLMLAEGRAVIDPIILEVRRERPILERLLSSLGFAVSSSQGNFVFARGPEASLLAGRLRDHGISIRSFTQPELDSCVRITCPGEPVAFDRLSRAILTSFPPQAILFDLDGVLADVSGSYDQAIIETCRHFGPAVSESDINSIKRGGDANNDWMITHRLLTQNGIEAKYEKVVAEFERRYQGESGRPGLHEAESPLIPVERLRALASRFSCAIVTGRPRRDAIRFLDRFEITCLFDAIVCREDTDEPKPSSQPIQLAIDRLRTSGRLTQSTSNIWMVGDTIDDLNAAIAAGVIPLCVCSPGSEETAASVLTDAGACLVRDSVLDFVDAILPLTREPANAACQ